jgi:hypothetical protein
MAASEVAICNSALSKVGADRIVSLTEDSRAGKLCNEQYEKIKKMLLRAHPWNFAIKRVALAASVTAPAFGYTYSFPVPSDFIRALHVNEDDYEWIKEGSNIVTDESTCELLYIADVPVGMFDASFDEVFALKLAHDLCGDITSSPTLKRDLFAEFTQALREARTFDAQEGFVAQVKTRTFLNARR